jgi:hypothetical protein
LSLYRYTDGREDGRNLSYAEAMGRKGPQPADDDFDPHDFGKPGKHDCDSESARALKRILALIDDLNNEDLHILQQLIERLLCSREKKRPC